MLALATELPPVVGGRRDFSQRARRVAPFPGMSCLKAVEVWLNSTMNDRLFGFNYVSKEDTTGDFKNISYIG